MKYISPASTSKVLSLEQVRQYEYDGCLYPIPVLTAEEVAAFRTALDNLEGHLGGKLQPVQVVQPHLHFRWAYDLATHPAVLDVVEDIIGPNILVHSTSIFCKYPHDPAYVSWHQDGYYWGLSAPRLVSAWIALSDSTPANGCMRAWTGSHRQRLPHHEQRHRDNLLASGLTVEVAVDEANVVDLGLRAGEMSLHHVNLVHGSGPNCSDSRRIGFAVRYIAPQVTQLLEHHVVVLARGRDEHHHYTLLDAPPTGSVEAGVAAQANFARQLHKRRLGIGAEDDGHDTAHH